MGTSGEGGRRRAPADARTGGPVLPPRRDGGLPDPLADALLNGAQRAYMDMAAAASRELQGWDVTWNLDGFRATDGQVTAGPVADTTALVTLVRAGRAR